MIEVAAKFFLIGAVISGMSVYFLMDQKNKKLEEKLRKSFSKAFVYKAIREAALPRGKNRKNKDAQHWNGALSVLEYTLRKSEGKND